MIAILVLFSTLLVANAFGEMNLPTLKIEIDLSKLFNTSNLFCMGLILSGPIAMCIIELLH